MNLLETEATHSTLLSIKDAMRRKGLDVQGLRDLIDRGIEDAELHNLLGGMVIGFDLQELEAILAAVDACEPGGEGPRPLDPRDRGPDRGTRGHGRALDLRAI